MPKTCSGLCTLNTFLQTFVRAFITPSIAFRFQSYSCLQDQAHPEWSVSVDWMAETSGHVRKQSLLQLPYCRQALYLSGKVVVYAHSRILYHGQSKPDLYLLTEPSWKHHIEQRVKNMYNMMSFM